MMPSRRKKKVKVKKRLVSIINVWINNEHNRCMNKQLDDPLIHLFVNKQWYKKTHVCTNKSICLWTTRGLIYCANKHIKQNTLPNQAEIPYLAISFQQKKIFLAALIRYLASFIWIPFHFHIFKLETQVGTCFPVALFRFIRNPCFLFLIMQK